jgi:hypothetical protein
MIAADLDVLKYEKKNEFAQILAMELGYMNQDFGVMAANGAMLAAFSFAAMPGPELLGVQGRQGPWRSPSANVAQGVEMDDPPKSNSWYGGSPQERLLGKYLHSPVMEGVFVLAGSTSLVCNLLLVSAATLLAVFGPISALHATNEETLEEAVKGLRESRKNLLRLQFCCLVLFAVTHVARMFYQWRAEIGFFSLLVVIYFIWWLQNMYADLVVKFQAPPLLPSALRWQIRMKKLPNTQKQGFLTVRTKQDWHIMFFQLNTDSIRMANQMGGVVEHELLWHKNLLFVIQALDQTELDAINCSNLRHVFQITCGLHHWILQASSDAEMNDWLTAVKRALDIDVKDKSQAGTPRNHAGTPRNHAERQFDRANLDMSSASFEPCAMEGDSMCVPDTDTDTAPPAPSPQQGQPTKQSRQLPQAQPQLRSYEEAPGCTGLGRRLADNTADSTNYGAPKLTADLPAGARTAEHEEPAMTKKEKFVAEREARKEATKMEKEAKKGIKLEEKRRAKEAKEEAREAAKDESNEQEGVEGAEEEGMEGAEGGQQADEDGEVDGKTVKAKKGKRFTGWRNKKKSATKAPE